MKCCLDCRKLKADSEEGISAAPDESSALKMRVVHRRGAGKEEQEPYCRANNSGFAEPVS